MIKEVYKEIIILCMLILRGTVGDSQVIMEVKDDNKLHQIEREVSWSEWDGHSPSWFYWLIELFEKDKYRDEDRRNLLQLLPTLASVRYNQKKTDDYKSDVDEVERQAQFKYLDYTVDLAYPLLKDELNGLRGQFEKSLERASQAGAYAEMMKELRDEQERIEGRIYVIRHSDIPNSDRREVYLSETKSYKKLIGMSQQIAHAFELFKK